MLPIHLSRAVTIGRSEAVSLMQLQLSAHACAITSEHSFHFTGLPRALVQLPQQQNITHHAVFGLLLANGKHQAFIVLQVCLTNTQPAPAITQKCTNCLCISGLLWKDNQSGDVTAQLA